MVLKNVMAAAMLLGVLGTVGCGGKSDAPHNDDKKHDDEGDHRHGTGPHGGVIFDLKYHGEFKPDHAKKQATVWMLAMDEKTPKRVKAEKLRLVVSNTNPKIEIDLLPTDAAPDGTASVFVGNHDGFGVEMEYKGTVSATIDGKPYTGDFEEKAEPKK